MQEMQVLSLGQEDPLEEEMATLSGILAWNNPWTEEPGRLTGFKECTQLSTYAKALVYLIFPLSTYSNASLLKVIGYKDFKSLKIHTHTHTHTQILTGL